MTSNSPLPFPETDNLPDDLRQVMDERKGLNVYRMIMHSPNTARGMLLMLQGLRHESTLPPPLREIATLRVGYRLGAAYEVHHHERMAREVGLSEAGISGAAEGPDAPGLSDDERLYVSLTDALLDRHGLSEAERSQFLASHSTNQLADLVILVGHYVKVSYFLSTFGVQIETSQ